MNKIFWSVLTFLIAGLLYLYLSESEKQSEYPLIYWKSDANPLRFSQVDVFNDWIVKKHPELTVKQGIPPFGLQLDAANNQSMLIQAVSGVGGDLLDSTPIQSYSAMGLIDDIGQYAKDGGFGLETTYPGASSLICSHEGKQMGYPCNLSVASFWINLNTMKKYDVELPKEEWTTADFERIATEFAKKANEGKKKRNVFFSVSAEMLGPRFCIMNARSFGEDIMNETLTKSTLSSSPNYVRTMKLLYKWTYTDRILPTSAEEASYNVESGGYGGAAAANFLSGNYAAFVTGRYSLIRFRELPKDKQIPLMNVQFPEDGTFRNLIVIARITALYAGSKNKEKAKYFFEYLASKEYNDSVIRHADGLPPTPKYLLNNPEFLSPREYPNEGNVHANELKWAMKIAFPVTKTPYFHATGQDWLTYTFNKFLNDRCTAEEAVREADLRINAEIAETVRKNPKLGEMYRKALALQEKIDEYKAAGKKIPENWILNPFYQKYYQAADVSAKTGRGK